MRLELNIQHDKGVEGIGGLLPDDLLLHLRPESLTCSGHGAIWGEVWFQFGEQGFPETGWSDIAGAVISAWLEAAVALTGSSNGSATVRFLDGPYKVRVFAKSQNSWEAELMVTRSSAVAIRQRLEFPSEPFIRILMSCADNLLERVTKNGWVSGDIDSIILQRERLFGIWRTKDRP